jgi:polyisoprenyl-phosphate glycosyltransferase
MAQISVVIPVYKADDCLDELYRRLKTSLESLTHDFEVLLVEDGGPDRSWEVIRKLAQKDPRIKGLRFSRNFGQHYGITAGLDHSDGDWTVVMDCDLQDRPEEIPNLYRKALEGYDVVLARRKHRSVDSHFLASSLFYGVFSWLSDIQYDKEVGNFRMMSRKVVKNLRSMRERLRFFGGLVDWLGFRTANVDVEHAPRHAGKTAYTFKKLYRLAAETIIAYSDKPLRLSVKFGFFMSIVSLAVGIWYTARALVNGSPVMGWPSLIVSLYFLGGIIIAILGVIGIYLGKTFDEAKKRPLYIVAESTFLHE